VRFLGEAETQGNLVHKRVNRGRISLPGSDQRCRGDRSRRTMCGVTPRSILFSDRSRPVASTLWHATLPVCPSTSATVPGGQSLFCYARARRSGTSPGYGEREVFTFLLGARAACPRRRDESGTPSLPGAQVTPGVNSYGESWFPHSPAPAGASTALPPDSGPAKRACAPLPYPVGRPDPAIKNQKSTIRNGEILTPQERVPPASLSANGGYRLPGTGARVEALPTSRGLSEE